MLWYWLAIAAGAVWAVGNVIDKNIIDRHIRNPLSVIMLGAPLNLIFGAAVWAFQGGSLPRNILYGGLIIGALNFFAVMLYFKGLKVEEASRVVPMIYVAPIFVLILAALLLGERAGAQGYAGVIMVIAGAVLISFRKVSGILKRSDAALMMVLAGFIWAIIDVWTKWATGLADYVLIISAVYLGAGLAGLSLWAKKSYRDDFRGDVSGPKPVLLVFSSFSIAFVGWLMYIRALTGGLVSLVVGLVSVQPLFVLFYTTVLGKVMPQIVKEDSSGGSFWIKLVATLLILGGVYLIG
ncbi:MAG: DMT family transporter [archaeon]